MVHVHESFWAVRFQHLEMVASFWGRAFPSLDADRPGSHGTRCPLRGCARTTPPPTDRPLNRPTPHPPSVSQLLRAVEVGPLYRRPRVARLSPGPPEPIPEIQNRNAGNASSRPPSRNPLDTLLAASPQSRRFRVGVPQAGKQAVS